MESPHIDSKPDMSVCEPPKLRKVMSHHVSESIWAFDLIIINAYALIQVHLNKLECREKVHFFL